MNKNKVIEIFCEVDDFLKEFDEFETKKLISKGETLYRNRKSTMSLSEKMTIYICFHLSSYTNFKRYYNELVKPHWADMFPSLITYERFNQTQDRLFVPLLLYLNNCRLGKCTGISFVDSTTLHVCHIKREKQNKVFMGMATKSKSTMGWFFGFKLHLIINDKGEILSFSLSRANKDDRDEDIMKNMVEQIFGKLVGDRGYISEKLAQYLWNNGVELIYKRRKNMKEMNLSDTDKVLIRKRALIETVNDELKNICCLQHTRHRAVQGFLNNLVTALIAYQFLDKKPALKLSTMDLVPDKYIIAA
jgi:hypothetical protein